MRIFHNPFVVLQSQQQQQQQHASNPFQELNTTISTNNNISGIIEVINNTTGVNTGLGTGTGTGTTNSIFQSNIQNLNNNPFDINSIVTIQQNLNGNTEDIVEKLSSIYGHIDDTINPIIITTPSATTSTTTASIIPIIEQNTNNIINSNNITNNINLISNECTNSTTNSNTFTNSFNQCYNSNNIDDNININNYYNNSNNIPTTATTTTTVVYDNYINNTNSISSCSSSNSDIDIDESINHNVNNDTIIINNNKELDEKYKNTLVNDANNQKTILNNLNRLNNDNQHQQQHQHFNDGNIGVDNECLNSNLKNINLRDNNNTHDLFLENLNVLCAKEDIKTPSSIEDFNIKTITGFNKLKSLQYYSDSSSQSSSDEGEDDDNEEEDNDDDDDEDDDTEDDTENEDQDYRNEKEIEESDDNIENDEIDKYQNKNKFHKGQKSKENNENDADVDEEEDYNESSSSTSSSSTTIQGIKKIRKNKNFNYGRDSVKLTNKITEFDLNEISRRITTSPIEHTATFSRIITTISNQQQIAATKGSSDINNIIKSPKSSLFYNKMAGDNEKNITNPEETEVYSETESVEMKSLQEEENVTSSSRNGSVGGDDIEEMEIDRNSEFLDDNDTKVDNNDIVENSIQNQNSDNVSTKRRCSSPAGCVSSSDNTISEKSFPIEEKVKNTTTSTSSASFASANSSNGSGDYPRGIINPNYPGFQHLAHTLSEHFVNHPNDPDDSDLSEFEVELSIDDDVIAFNNDNQSEIQQKSDEKKLNEFLTKSNNSISSSKSNSSQIDEYHHNLMDVSNKCIKDIREHKEILLPEIRISFECHDLKLEDRFDLKDSPKRLAITTSQEKVPKVNKLEKAPKISEKNSKFNDSNTDCINDGIIEDISCDLDTYLKKYETATDIKLKNQNKALVQQQYDQQKIIEQLQEIKATNKTDLNETKLVDSDVEEGRNCPTPDILIKNCKNDFRRNKNSVANRPDLLRNVSPQPPCDEFPNTRSSDEELLLNQIKSGSFKLDHLEKVIKTKPKENTIYQREPTVVGSELNKREGEKISRISIPNNILIEDRRNDSKIEDSSFGTTPVDIVGDFGREVEREFGLLVSGYNSRILCRDASPKRFIDGNQSPSPTKIENHEKKFIQKMADAHLSDAKENISFGSTTAPILNLSVGSSKTSSMIANIVVARATLNHPTTDLIMVSNTSNTINNKANHYNSIPCDLLVQTNNSNNNNNNNNKLAGVKTPSFDGDLKVTQQIPQKQQNQEQKIIEEKLLPSLLVSSTSNLEKPVKKIPPPPPPRRFLQQQLQQMQKRQHELQLQKQQQQQQQQQQKQQQNEQQQNQIDKQKYANNISQHNPFVSAASNANQIELNKTNQHIKTETTTTTEAENINAFEKLSKNNILSTSSSSILSLSTQQQTSVPDTQQQSSAINNQITTTTTTTTTTNIIENNENNSDSCYVSDSGHIKLDSSTNLTKTDDIIKSTTEALISVSSDKKFDEEEKQKAFEEQQQQQQFPTAIIKPKYQKFSYDDRQLPPVGIGVFEQNSRPWYEKNLNINSAGGNNLSSGSGSNTNSGGNNIESHRKIRKNLNSNVNLSSYKSDQRYNTTSDNSSGGTPNKSTLKNKHSRSSALNQSIVVDQLQQSESQKYISNCVGVGIGNSLQSIGEGHRSPSNRHSSSSRSHHHHHHHHHHHNRNHNSSSSNNSNGHHTTSNKILKENLSSIGSGGGGGSIGVGSGSSIITNTVAINNGFVAIVTPRKKEKIITHDDEFIRHDIYKSLTKHNININNNNSYLLNNNNNNNQTTNINLKNDMNSRGGVIGYANINGIKSVGGIGIGGGGGGILIDNSYRTVIRNDSKSKYILNLNNKSNNNIMSGIGNGNGNANSGSSNGIYKGGNNKHGKNSSSNSASFDVYNIETALPSIDMDAIESHLQKAKEDEKKRRNDREEIRRRLAMGAEDDYFSRMVNNTTSNDRPGRKPSLQSRLQNGNNLQICFMNDASSDTESISSDSETCPKLSSKSTSNASSRYSSMSSVATSNPYNSRPLSVNITNNNNNNNNNTTTNNSRRTLSQRPSTLSLGPPISEENSESDFFTKQARLQIEARMALAQAKDMAHMQMEIERQKQKESPITEVIRNSMEKVGVNFPIEKRRVSRQMCTDMNIAQLQIIVNDLHTQIERLNDHLVQYLMERDELHMSQDSMLVDIEDLTRYLSAKEQTLLNEITDRKNSTELGHHQQHQLSSNNNSPNGIIKSNHDTPQMQSKFQRIANLVKK